MLEIVEQQRSEGEGCMNKTFRVTKIETTTRLYITRKHSISTLERRIWMGKMRSIRL